MELLKDLTIKKTLSILRDVTGKIWILIGSTLFTIFLIIEIGKSASDIYCDAEFNDKDENLINKKCYLEYQNKYSKLPVYGFVLINFFTLAIVPIIFSIHLKLRVNKLETPNQNLERQLQQNRSKVLFYTYCGQLASTILLATGFIIVLHTSVFRASTHFPSNFKCILLNQGSNSSAFSSTYGSLTKTDIYTCHNTRATEKFGRSVALTVFNGIWAIFALIELVWNFSRAWNGPQFMCDPQFYADHLRSNREQEQRQQQRQEQSEEAGLLSGLRSEQQAELQAKLERLKDCIIIRTERLEDLNQPIRTRPGEGSKPKDLELDPIFVKLVIHDRIANYDFPEDRREQLRVFPKPKSNQSEYVPWQDIIDGNNKHILLVGRPGIGKTILSTKLLRGSAFNEFKYQNFDVAFLVKFRHYNSRGEDLDLRKLLSCSETVSQHLDDEVWNYIITNPTKVLLIFDGIDEFNARSAISNDDSRFNDSEEEKMPLHCLYKKIASGKLLKGATVITTSRPTASSCVRQLRFDKVLEILGFTSEEIEDYVTRFTKEDQNPETEKKAIWQHISTNFILFTLCYVPVNCFIICSCLSWWRSSGKSLPTKLTKIYSTALKIFYFRHNDKYRMSEEARDQLFLKPFHELPTECKKDFQRLGLIAFDGIKEGRLLFTSEEVEGLEDCGLLHRLPDLPSQEGLDEDKAQYCFIHLTFQEFLAARHVVDTMTEAQELEEFITVHTKKGSWQLVVQFVAGLLVDTDEVKQLQFSEILMKLLPMSTSEVEGQLGLQDTECLMTGKPTVSIRWLHGESETNLAVTICKCLYELDIKQESSITSKMEEMSFDEVWFGHCKLAPADCRAILHFLKNYDKKFTLCLRANFMGDLSCLEFKNWIVESDFCRGSCNLEGLSFAVNDISEKGVGYLCDALKSEKCSLTLLVLNHNDVGDKAAELLSGAIKDGNCKLTRLNLEHNKIRLEGVEHLKDALKYVNNNLTELNLALNDILDKGAEYLSDALKDVNCKLTLLNLSFNFIGDKGAEYLSDALKDVNCKLTLLKLEGNYVGDKGAEYLSDALKDVNCGLTFLDLTQNYVGDKGAEHLSNAVKDVNRKLTVLNLVQNGVEDKGAEYLKDVEKDFHQKLILLKLALYDGGDKEAEHFSDALRDLHQKLTELKLAPIKTGAEYLSDALNDLLQKLAVLNLPQNDVGVKGVEYIRRNIEHFFLKLCVTQNSFGDKPEKDSYPEIMQDLHHNLAVLKLALNDVGDK